MQDLEMMAQSAFEQIRKGQLLSDEQASVIIRGLYILNGDRAMGDTDIWQILRSAARQPVYPVTITSVEAATHKPGDLVGPWKTYFLAFDDGLTVKYNIVQASEVPNVDGYDQITKHGIIGFTQAEMYPYYVKIVIFERNGSETLAAEMTSSIDDIQLAKPLGIRNPGTQTLYI